MALDPTLPEIDETLLATTRYLQALTVLDDVSVRRPSVLPGWTRAHVVAHVSRNADAFTGVLASAGSGERAAMYSAQEARDLDIEDTVRSHDLPALLEDARTSALRFEREARAYDGPPDATYTRTRDPDDDHTFPVATVGPRRRAEVEIHHADLDIGYEPARWPADFSARMVKQRQDEMAALPQGCPSMVLSATDVDGLWKFGVGQGPEIHGTLGDLAYWLVGRGGGRGLTSSSGELPTLGRWR
jgi:maleylpyruvate isomerase